MTCRLFSDYSEDLVFQGCPLSPSFLELAPLKDEIGSPLCLNGNLFAKVCSAGGNVRLRLRHLQPHGTAGAAPMAYEIAAHVYVFFQYALVSFSKSVFSVSSNAVSKKWQERIRFIFRVLVA